MKTRSWCFTLNNYTNDDLAVLCSHLYDVEDEDIYAYCDAVYHKYIKYMIFSFEVGDSGTPHIQGYVYFENPVNRPSELLLSRAHYEPANGTPDQNRNYVLGLVEKKGNKLNEDHIEFGYVPTKGKASWNKICESVADPKNNFHTFHQYKKTYKIVMNKEREWQQPKLIICDSKYVYKLVLELGLSYNFSHDDTYDSQDVFIDAAYTTYHSLYRRLLQGLTPEIKRGYEIIKFLPRIIIMTFDDVKEFNHLIKSYVDYIDHVLQTEDDLQTILQKI